MIRCYVLTAREHFFLKDTACCNPAMFSKIDSVKVGDTQNFSIDVMMDGQRFVAVFNDSKDGFDVYVDLLSRLKLEEDPSSLLESIAFISFAEFDEINQRFKNNKSNIANAEDFETVCNANDLEARKDRTEFWFTV